MNFKKSIVKFKGTKEIQTEIKNQTDNVISRRFYMMIGTIVFIGVVLISTLFIRQIQNQDYYSTKVNQYTSNTIEAESLRGAIYDRDYNLLVYNKKIICATYYNVSGIKDEEIDLMIKFLIDNINIDTSNITVREMKDYLIKKDVDYVNSLINEEEEKAIDESENPTKELYQMQLQKLNEDILNKKLTEYDLKYYKLWFSIKNCTQGAATLLEDITVQEASLIGENAFLLRGVKVTTDWTRDYPYGSEFKSVLGNVTTKKQGLPLDQQEILLAKGYSNNSRVGTSGLEAQYQDILAGTKAKYKLTYDSNGNPLVETIDEGKKGSNIQLTIDWDLQMKLSKKVSKLLLDNHEEYHNKLFVILIDPNNGEILAMSGKRWVDGEIIDWTNGAYLEAYRMGSSVKGGSIYTFFKNDIIEADTVIVDEPIKIKGTDYKKSHETMGAINEITALERSSNVYMFKNAIKLGGDEYAFNQAIDINLNAFDVFRNNLGDLGLGVKTGLDVPNESLGYKGPKEAGKLLDLAIGQYDTYTTIQLAQYVSTIANDGVKVQPHFFKSSFTNDDEGKVVTQYEKKITILDDVSEHIVAFEQIKKGFYNVVNGDKGTARNGYKPDVASLAGKTGTAEDYTYTGKVDHPNHMFVGYSPAEDPQIAIACMSERQKLGNDCKPVTKYILDEYFKKYGVKTN